MKQKELWISQDIITKFISAHPFCTVTLVVLVFLVITGMQISNNTAVCALMIGGYLLVLGYGLFLKKTKRFDDSSLIVLIFLLGFVLRLGYVLYTDISTRQNDIGEFEEGTYNIMHSGYILFVRDTGKVPDFDITGLGQFYHPPFHYIVCAIFLRIYEFFLPRGTHNYEALQALSLLWSSFSLILIYKIVKLIGIPKEMCGTVALIIAAFPTFTLLSGSINNDSLSIVLYFTAFYFGLKWFKKSSWQNIILCAFATGFGMMTKLSVGMIAFPIGFLFIVRLVKGLKNQTGIKTILNLVVFGMICVPLGLWYQIRNYLKYGIPITYVLRSDNIYQDISRYSPLQRIFGFYGLPINDYYINLGSDGKQDYNIFITIVKTALFGEENYRDDFAMSLAGYALVLVFLVLILISLAGLVFVIVNIKNSASLWEELSIIVTTLTMAVSIISFSLNYPHICSMNFRYSTSLLLCGTFFLCKFCGIKFKGKNQDLITKLTGFVSCIFFCLSLLFYTMLWTYVKGSVEITEPIW